MAMKKAEMEQHHETYRFELLQARSAEQQGLFHEAIQLAKRAWNYVDGMLQYERRYGNNEIISIAAIDMVIKYAPPLFDFKSLDELEALLEDYKRIERDTKADMTDKSAEARERLWANHKLWDHLESNPECLQSELSRAIGGDQDYWRSVTEIWERMGLLLRVPEKNTYRITLVTRMDALTAGKCPECGVIAVAPKAMFLESTRCVQCHKPSIFVLMANSHVTI